MVPGGQQTYVAPSGEIGYTQAHSAFMPAGSYIGGFTSHKILDEDGMEQTIVSWQTPGNPAYSMTHPRLLLS